MGIAFFLGWRRADREADREAEADRDCDDDDGDTGDADDADNGDDDIDLFLYVSDKKIQSGFHDWRGVLRWYWSHNALCSRFETTRAKVSKIGTDGEAARWSLAKRPSGILVARVKSIRAAVSFGRSNTF